MMTRRQALMRTLFGVGGIGLRALATGIPAAFFLNPKRAVAQACVPSKAQYFILSTSGNGDPINAGAPGTYADSKIIHSPFVTGNSQTTALNDMTPTQFMMAGKQVTGAKPWSTLPQNVLDRTVFWHLMTNTPIHPKEPEVLQLNGATPYHEMLPSLLAKAVSSYLPLNGATCGTVQLQPISVGGAGPTEAISYNGSVLPIIPPIALKDTLTSPTLNAPAGAIAGLQSLRDTTIKIVYTMYKTTATPAVKVFIDATVNTQDQLRSLNQSLIQSLSMIATTTDPVQQQLLAAVTLIQMNVAPVISIHIPFGGDNHSDPTLTTESTQTVSGVGYIASLMSQLAAAGLQDQVTFMTLNVFGRTLATNAGTTADNGRAHNPNHQVSVTIGKPFKGGVIGGVTPVSGDYGAMGVVSATGAASASGDVAPVDTLGSYAQTLLQAVGGDPGQISQGKVITAALA